MCFVHCIARFAPLAFFALVSPIQAQSINISNFYYRDYLDFGQNKGVFKESAESSNGLEITGKNGEKLKIPHIPNFYASSNNGNLTAVGRGFTATANHVTSAEQQGSSVDLRRWGLTEYQLAKENNSSGDTVESVSQPYGRDDKFLRFQKYIIEGQAEMLDITNSINKSDKAELAKEDSNKKAFNDQMTKWANSSDDNKVLIYQAGSGLIALRGNSSTEIDRRENGETKGGGFGYIPKGSNTGDYGSYWDLITGYGVGNTRGLVYNYSANSEQDFNNRITSGDSGSGFYVYDSENKKWLLLGVTSRNSGAEKPSQASNSAEVAFISNKDLENYRQKFEQKINLKISDSHTNTWSLNNQQIEYTTRGDTPKDIKTLSQNKDLIFSGGGNIEVGANIYRNISGFAGGFVFESSADSTKTTYKFTNKNGQTYIFDGSGLDIGENVVVEWALKNKSGESLHKVGKGELKIKTQNNSDTNLGTLKIGEGKVTLDTDAKAFDNIYITSGRGELTLMNGKAEALGATKNNGLQGRSGASNATSYTLAQSKNSEMGFYFGTGGGKLDLGGNSLTLNTIAANDKNAIVMSASQATLTIEGFGYESDSKSSNKKDTIIHATIGDTNSNIDIAYSGSRAESKNKSSLRAKRELSVANHLDNTSAKSQNGLPRLAVGKSRNDDSVGDSTPSLRVSEANAAIQNSNEAHLIFDGNIDTKGKLSVTNGNVALQGHATAHATISDKSLIEKIKTAEKGTSKEMPDYMDLSKPSTLTQPDWDNRAFKFGNDGITLTNSNLTLGRNATLESNITLDTSSKVDFGGSVTHFIDNKDGKNVTGSGFSYQQEVESGTIGTAQEQIANQTISYKGKITANGGTINSSIFDFNASLDLKDSANLSAEYLTLTNSNTISLASGTSASVKTLKLNNVTDTSKIFQNGSGGKLTVTEAFWFENTQNFDLSKLESTSGLEKGENYDIVGVKSSITGTSKDLSANVSLFEGASLALKSLTLKNVDSTQPTTRSTKSNESDSSDSTKIKNRVYLGNDSSDSGDSTQSNNLTKLTLTNNLKAENLDSATIELRGKSEISAQSIEFSSVKDGKLILDGESKLTLNNGAVEVKGSESKLNITLGGGGKSFNINAENNSEVTISSLQDKEVQNRNIVILSEAKNPNQNNANSLDSSATLSPQNDNRGRNSMQRDSSPRQSSAQNDNVGASATFQGKITAKDSSVITTALDSITASVDLQGSAKLTAKNIELTNGFDSIKLQGSSNLTADKITAQNLNSLTISTENGATAKVSEFIFDGGTTNLNGDSLIGDKITLQNSSTLKTTSDLEFNSDSCIVTTDASSKLEVSNLKVTSGTLSLNFNDSKQNASGLQKIDLSGGGNVSINSWDFGNTTTFSGNGNSRATFGSASYTQNGNAKTISADSTISGALQLSSVGKNTTQKARNANPQNSTNRFESLKFSDKTLTLGENSTITVTFDDSIKKSNYQSSGITLGQYYTLISASGITDNRTNKIITFNFSNESDALFVVGKFFDNKELKIKFTESDPRAFSELIKHINPRYSEVLKALTEAYPQDSAIELSANTDDYAVLESRVRGIDEAMNSIAQGNASRLMQNLLFSNDYTINTRVLQVRLARATQGKTPLRFAQNGTLYRLQKLKGEAVASDAMPSYRVESDSVSGVELPNSAWLNVGGGYFGGSAQMGFGATNIGYDRIFSANGGDVMLGAMMGFGGSKGARGGLSESAIFYNFGLYIDSVFDARSGAFGGHELQSNLNFSVSENHKNFALDSDAHESHNQNAWSAKNSAFGTLLSIYYKYNFIVASDEKISHALKPIALLAVGYNRNGAFASAEYKQGAFGSASVAYGLGVEYNAVMSDSFYSISAVLKDIVWSGNKRVDVGLNGARNLIGYTLETAPRFGVELNLVGSHKVYEMGENGSLYVQYGITGMVDMGANYGVKGDVKMGWRF